ncbi:kinase-like protein [Athelia psychrophila]|uniref:Kinase-like protein n=1 Tax=Athelia psychrophila TaxID=1759441 RepID=A0A166K710_9AGAM|nr:kinase-like protein [Fibularhizoctonia sp. CBS 109695]
MSTPTDLDTIPPDLTNKIVYEMADMIKGGHARICKGVLTNSEGTATTVAVKVIMGVHSVTGKVTSVDRRKCCKRGRREQKVWEVLADEHIVPFLGITTDFPSSFAGPNPVAMISPWMKNGDLFGALESTPPPEDTARLHLLCGAAKGLQYLHSLGIIHGDLYPANVLIDDDGNARLTDFGMSFMVPLFVGTSYWSQTVGGAMRWRAPELIAPLEVEDIEEYVPDLTFECDIYSFGSLSLHVMSGERPYPLSRDVHVVIHLYNHKQPSRPRAQRLTDAHWHLATWCWGERGNPASRPTAEEVVAAISII